jgi:hypothetical protein
VNNFLLLTIAHDTRLNRIVALKILSDRFAEDPECKQWLESPTSGIAWQNPSGEPSQKHAHAGAGINTKSKEASRSLGTNTEFIK